MNYTGTSSGCGNVKPISYNWSSTGSAIPVYWNVSVGEVQFGFEITSSSGGMNFHSQNFSVTAY